MDFSKRKKNSIKNLIWPNQSFVFNIGLEKSVGPEAFHSSFDDD